MTTLEIYVIRDTQNGDVLAVLDDRDDAEERTVQFVGTFSGSKENPIPTVPILERYEVTVGEPDEVMSANALRRRVATRRRRREREYEAVAAEFRKHFLPEPDETLRA